MMQQQPDKLYYMHVEEEDQETVLQMIGEFFLSVSDSDMEEALGEKLHESTNLTISEQYICFNILIPHEEIESFMNYASRKSKKTKTVVWGAEECDDTFSDTREMIMALKKVLRGGE